MRCPVEETGRNSVRPSTMPRMIAVSQMPIYMSGGLREAAVAAILDEPALGDRRERGGRDAELGEPRRAARDDLVVLEHPPLILGDRRTGLPAQAACERRGDDVRAIDEPPREPGRTRRPAPPPTHDKA